MKEQLIPGGDSRYTKKKVIWVADETLSIGGDSTYIAWLDQCPTCKSMPTYGEEFCPYCNQWLDREKD